MGSSVFIITVVLVFGQMCFLPQGQNLRLRNALADFRLNDLDNDNIPGTAGVDYPVHNTVPDGTSFRCKDYEYAGYFADMEADCQAYHVCFPDGRNASFLCVNGTVFHQRYFVCDWWFHFNCSHAASLYDLNLFRKIPLPVLPPVQRRPFIRPVPEPKVALMHIPTPPKPQKQKEEKDKQSLNPKDEKQTTKPKTDKDEKKTTRPPNERSARNNPINGKKLNDQCNCTCDGFSNKYLQIH